MTKTTKIIALLLTLLTALSLAACGTNTIVGKWSYAFDMSAYIDAMSADMRAGLSESEQSAYEELFGVFDGVSIDMIMEFRDDATYSFSVDEASVDAAQEKVREGLKTAMPKMYTAMGVDLDAYLNQFDISLDDLIESSMQSFDFAALKENSGSGSYRLEGDKLYTANEGEEADDSKYLTVELSGNTLKITDVVGSVEGFEQYKDILMPMEFTRLA